jgi:uncharacterized protein
VIFVGFVLLVALLLLYGNLVAYRGVRAPVVVAMNMAVGAGLVILARGVGLSWHALGLDAGNLPTGLLWAGVMALIVLLGGAIILVTPLRRAFRDIRAVDMRPATMAFHYLVRIPFGTALFEEVVFRGFLLALLAREGSEVGAVLWSSVAFGLWHIGASLDFLRANRPEATLSAKTLAVVSGVAVTTMAGILFCVLRIAAESLVAPILAHAAFNVVGLTLARSEGRPVTEPAGP